MAAPLAGKNREPMHILEAGAGTGAVTAKVLENLIEGDTLIVCELNPRMVERLSRNLEKNELYHQFKDQITIFEGPVQDVPEDKPFDCIISSLPFLNFELELVEDIFSKYKRVSTADTVMTYYEYIGLRSLGRTLSPPKRKNRLRQLDSYLRDLFERCQTARTRGWMNFLPINIYTLQVQAI
jgi:16S rRNA A1518/A1519 N6-dimethyltransferase RsmA/KsgA/DIM1 with predicted DNA glycosylase/AP lyase activity